MADRYRATLKTLWTIGLVVASVSVLMAVMLFASLGSASIEQAVLYAQIGTLLASLAGAAAVVAFVGWFLYLHASSIAVGHEQISERLARLEIIGLEQKKLQSLAVARSDSSAPAVGQSDAAYQPVAVALASAVLGDRRSHPLIDGQLWRPAAIALMFQAGQEGIALPVSLRLLAQKTDLELIEQFERGQAAGA